MNFKKQIKKNFKLFLKDKEGYKSLEATEKAKLRVQFLAEYLFDYKFHDPDYISTTLVSLMYTCQLITRGNIASVIREENSVLTGYYNCINLNFLHDKIEFVENAHFPIWQDTIEHTFPNGWQVEKDILKKKINFTSEEWSEFLSEISDWLYETKTE